MGKVSFVRRNLTLNGIPAHEFIGAILDGYVDG